MESTNIRTATQQYEHWLGSYTPVISSALTYKHKKMREDLFCFFRATFYRWAQLYPLECDGLCDAPTLLAVADLHVDSFGTWRDIEGRLVWGVDDFDEAYPLPYTYDLVRLAASAKIAIKCEELGVKTSKACELILDGYRDGLKSGGCPIVLEEEDERLRTLGIRELEAPNDFWAKLNRSPAVENGGVPKSARRALEKELPEPDLPYKIVRRLAGVGSLGQPRFVAIARWRGGYLAREAKAMVPSACLWLTGRKQPDTIYHNKIIQNAARCHDPYQKVHGNWLVRRLSPDSNPIEIGNLPEERDEERLLYTMGCEVANIHVGTPGAIKSVQKDLAKRQAGWLREAAKQMAKAYNHEWKVWKNV
jgi:hypothetical protein